MTLSAKITLLVFVTLSLFVTITSIFLWHVMNDVYHRQALQELYQKKKLVEDFLEKQQRGLQEEAERIKTSLFREDQAILTSMLSAPPDFTPAVVRFAENLRARTSFDFLSLHSLDGMILSHSLYPATFGYPDPRPGFPLQRPLFLRNEAVTVEYRTVAEFGHHRILLHAGYFLKDKLSSPGMTTVFLKEDPSVKHPEPDILLQEIPLPGKDGKPVSAVVVGVPTAPFQSRRAELVKNSTMLIAAALGISLLLGHFLSIWISHPLEELRNASISMERGDLSTRIHTLASGEIGEVIAAFNSMADQLEENRKKLIQTERIAAWQEIARHLAHEIKNPLTPIRTSITNLKFSLEKAPEKFQEIFSQATDSILEEVEKLRSLADEFSRFARLPAPQFSEGNLNEVIQKCLLLYRPETTVKISFEPGEVPRMKFDAKQISEVIHNLIQNAVDAMENEGSIRVKTGTVRSGHRLEGFIVVEDTGAGIDPAIGDRIFIPYFTTKTKGTGLGLAIVQRIIIEHGGKIEVESTPGKGTRFEIRLPVISD